MTCRVCGDPKIYTTVFRDEDEYWFSMRPGERLCLGCSVWSHHEVYFLLQKAAKY